MTTIPSTTDGTSSRTRYVLIGLAASVVHMLLMIPGYNDNGNWQGRDYLVVFAISVVVAALLFTLVVPEANAVVALVLGILAVLTGVVFWLGITLPIAAAAVLVGWRERPSEERFGKATIGAALGAIGAVLVVVIILGDYLA